MRAPGVDAKPMKITFGSLYLQHRPGNGSFMPGAENLTPAHLALFALDDSQQQFIGNAALIAPGLAIAAWHVVVDYDAKFRNGSAFLVAGGWDKQGPTIWHGEAATRIGQTDLVVLALKPANIRDGSLYFHFFSAIRMPRIDESVTVVASLPEHESEVQLKGDAMLNLAPHCRAGRVTAEYPFGRDRRTLPWACVEVDLPTEGGMSGAPVFDEQGALFGIVCSSMGGQDGQEARPTYVSLLYPALLHTCVRTWPDREERLLCEMHGLDLDRPAAFSRDHEGRLRGHIRHILE